MERTAGAIGMWQSRAPFVAGFLLTCAAAAVAAQTAEPPRQSQSVKEFVRLAEIEGQSETGSAAADAQVSIAGAGGSGARPVTSVSLVDLVARDGDRNGSVTRISLVELVTGAGHETAAPVAPGPSTVEVASAEIPSRIRDESTSAAGDATAPKPLPSTAAPAPAAASKRAEPRPSAQSGDRPAELPPAADMVRTPAPYGLPEPEVPTEASVSVPPVHWSDVSTEPLAASLPRAAMTPGPAGPLGLEEAIRRALNEHPSITESLSRLEAQHEQVSVARAGYWPQLRTGINSGYRDSTGRSEEALTLSASQMLYDFGKVSSAVQAAASGADREAAGVLLAAEDLIRETAQAFIEARRYEALLALASEQIEAIAELEELASKRSALGASSVSDEVQARSRREAAKAVHLQMQAQRDQWFRALENLIGSSEPVALDAGYPQQLDNVCLQLPENFDNAPRVVMAEAERAEAEAAIRQARADQRPTLSLSADYEHYLNREDNRFQQLDDQELVLRLNLTSTLFQGDALQARSRAAEHALQSATAARDRALLELSRFYRESRDRSRSLGASLTLQDERYQSIVRTQELYRHQYLSLGTRTLLDILNTEQEIFQTRVDKQNTISDLRSLQIDCLHSVGRLREAFRAGAMLTDRVARRHGEEGA